MAEELDPPPNTPFVSSNLCVGRHHGGGKDREKEQSAIELTPLPGNDQPNIPARPKTAFMGFKVVRPVGEWAASSPTQLSVGGDPLDQNPARGNKRVLTSTLLFPADDSFRLMIAMLIQIGEFSPLLRRSVFKCGGWVLVVGDYKIPPECHRHVPIHHLEMTLG